MIPASRRAGAAVVRHAIGKRKLATIALGERGKRVVLSWVPDWSWGLPFLVLTVIAHVSAILWTAKMLVTYRGMAAKKASHFVIFVAFAALGCVDEFDQAKAGGEADD